jgi:hypothetical protein
MKVKELIELLQKQDHEKEVMIQQGEEYDYMTVHSVKEKDLIDMDFMTDDGEITAVVIQYL